MLLDASGLRYILSRVDSRPIGCPAIKTKLIDRWVLLLLPIVAAFQFWAASHYTIFDDEAFSCLRYTMPLGEMIPALYHGIEPDPPLYYILQNLWVHQFGVEPWALRSVSIILFTCGLLAIRAAARAWFNPRVATVTFLICALHPAHFFFGFAARWYSAMFLMVSLLMWVTARLRANNPQSEIRNPKSLWIAWSLIAAAVCYTNYFGAVVVGLAWLAGIVRPRNRLPHWLLAGLGAAVLYALWAPAFWRTLRSFPPTDGGITSYAATAGRSLSALAVGNLASPGAWWIWPLIVISAACMLLLLLRNWNDVRPLPLIVFGCLAAGVASRTMIDKYTLTFSGPTCMLFAALLTKRGDKSSPSDSQIAVVSRWLDFCHRLAVCSLAAAWLCCGVNLLRENHWSSLRWLDPFAKVIEDAAATKIPCADWVATHPSARYYAAKSAVRASLPDSGLITPAKAWREFAAEPTASQPNAIATPASMLGRIAAAPPEKLITLETAGFADSPDWKALRERLQLDYQLASKRSYLEDPNAALKDLIDPQYHHPRWRIELNVWAIRR